MILIEEIKEMVDYCTYDCCKELTTCLFYTKCDDCIRIAKTVGINTLPSRWTLFDIISIYLASNYTKTDIKKPKTKIEQTILRILLEIGVKQINLLSSKAREDILTKILNAINPYVIRLNDGTKMKPYEHKDG